MKLKILYNILTISILLLFGSNIIAQKVSDYSSYKTKYNDKNVVGLSIQKDIVIDIVKEDLSIKETNFEEIYYNNYKAGAFAQDKVQSSHFVKIENIEASTLLPNNDSYKEIKVKDFTTKEVLSDNSFYEDLFSTTFVYPSLREGAITRLKYTLSINEPRFLLSEVVQRFYPVENFILNINTDKNVVLGIKYYNLDTTSIDFTKTEKGNRIIYSWKQKNIKNYKIEDDSPGFRHFLPQIVPYIKAYNYKGKEIPVTRNLDDLFKWYEKIISQVNLDSTEQMAVKVQELTKDCTTDLQKVETIYKWVQNNIKYIAIEYGTGGFVPRNPSSTFAKKYGDCKDMASLLIKMLDIAGVKAYYTWVGTRELPYLYTDIPSSIVDNHMIAIYVEYGKYYYLDATNPYHDLRYPTGFIQGKEALIRVDKQNFKIINIPEVEPEVNAITDSLIITIDNNKLIGRGRAVLCGYVHSTIMRLLQDKKELKDQRKFLNNYLEKGNNKFTIDKFSINEKDYKINIDYDFNIEGYVTTNADNIYINLNLSNVYVNLKQLKEDRIQDLSLDYKTLNTSKYYFKIPEGYKINYLPENKSFKNDNFSYDIHYELRGETIEYSLVMKINTLLVKKDMFNDWNAMLKQVNSDDKDVVVLKKL